MINTVAVGSANFIFIFLKAFQQRNVAFLHYGWVIPTSVMMGVVEVGVVGAVAMAAMESSSFFDLWPLIVAVGLGGGAGAVASMWVHHKYIGVKNVHNTRECTTDVSRGEAELLRDPSGITDGDSREDNEGASRCNSDCPVPKCDQVATRLKS